MNLPINQVSVDVSTMVSHAVQSHGQVAWVLCMVRDGEPGLAITSNTSKDAMEDLLIAAVSSLATGDHEPSQEFHISVEKQ